MARETILQPLKKNLSKGKNCMRLMGDLAFINLRPYKKSSIAKRICHKLATKYFGPYPIEEKVGKVAYRIQLPE